MLVQLILFDGSTPGEKPYGDGVGGPCGTVAAYLLDGSCSCAFSLKMEGHLVQCRHLYFGYHKFDKHVFVVE